MAKCEHSKVRQSCAICKSELVYRAYQYKAVKRNLAFTLTLDQFKKLVGVNAYCEYCGVWGGEVPLGIDRRENKRGYIFSENPVINNTVSCCGDCNFLKGRFSRHVFLAQVTKIAAYQEKLRKKTAQ